MSRCLGILVTKFYSTIALEICLGMVLYLTLRTCHMSMPPCFAFIFTLENIGCHSSILCLIYFFQGWSNPSFSPAFQVFPWPCRSWAITRSFLWSSSEVLYLWLSRFTDRLGVPQLGSQRSQRNPGTPRFPVIDPSLGCMKLSFDLPVINQGSKFVSPNFHNWEILLWIFYFGRPLCLQ